MVYTRSVHFVKAVGLQIEKSKFAFSIAVAENSRLFM